MSELEEIENRVLKLQSTDLKKFRAWFRALEDDLWDRQIEADFNAGKFNKLIQKARKEFAQGKAREL